MSGGPCHGRPADHASSVRQPRLQSPSRTTEIWCPIGPPPRQRPAPVAEEAGLVLQRVHRDAGHRHPGGRQPRSAIARQVELPVRLAPAGGEEPDVGRVARQHRVAQVGADLVRLLPDARADGRGDPPGAQRPHGGDGRLQHARHRAAPAGMGGADHPGLGVAEQHRRAVGGDDAQGDAGPVGHHGVGAGAFAGGPGRGGVHHRRAVHLRQADQRGGLGADCRGRRGRGSPARRRASPGRTGCSSGWRTGRRTRRRGG